jgi:hypothetical protein
MSKRYLVLGILVITIALLISAFAVMSSNKSNSHANPVMQQYQYAVANQPPIAKQYQYAVVMPTPVARQYQYAVVMPAPVYMQYHYK